MKKILFITSIIALSLLGCKKTNRDLYNNDNNVRRLNVNVETREYILYIPDSYDGSTKLPMVLNFHGYLGKAKYHLGEADMRSLAESENFILVYPQGAKLNGITHWNVGAWTEGSTADDIGFVNKILDAVISSYNIDQTRIYACGFSNGGAFSYELACKLSNRIAAIGAISATMTDKTLNNCNCSHPMPLLSIHGTADEILAYDGTSLDGIMSQNEILTYWSDYNNSDFVQITNFSNNVEKYIYANGDNNTAIEHYKIKGGTHQWSIIDFPDTNTNQLLWDFMSKYDINGLR